MSIETIKLEGKKLLLLGGSALICDVITTARFMGIETLITDWYPVEKSPGKKVADKYFMVSTADVDAVVQLIKTEKIDGVLTGFTDSTLPYYQKVCEKAGLPCYANAQQIDITTNKIKFKELCHVFDVPVVEEYEIDASLNIKQLSRIKYPVIVKPVDNSGGRGISICYNQKELKTAYQKALTFSERGSVIVERYMTGKEVTIFYLLQDGNIHLTLMGNRHVKRNQEGVIPLPVAYTFPSIYLPAFQGNINKKVIKMFKHVGMQNGMVFIQSFVENGECIFYEMGYRLTGSLEYKIIEKLNGINPMEMMISHALTGNMGFDGDRVSFNPNHKLFGCNITFIARPGRIGKIVGLEKVIAIPGVIDVVPTYKEGDIVHESVRGTLKQVVVRAFATAETKAELASIMDKIHNSIDVVSTEGESMLLGKFDVKDLFNEI